MSEFWPSDLDLNDTSTPLEILQAAQQEWTEHSNGLLTLVIQEAESTNRNHLLIVHAKHVPSNRTVTLFSVVHRPSASYPAKIQPRDDELPDILKRSYYRPGIADYKVFGDIQGGEVTNSWVCETPSEFRSQLKKVFNLGILKAEVLSLVSGIASSSRAEDGPEKSNGASDGESDDTGE